ncbi:hypothetical protein D6D04_06385 [Aureobasidium pullulans]|nr:hypothetical protein D6D04_06385 [Aureobasidium pullulans]
MASRHTDNIDNSQNQQSNKRKISRLNPVSTRHSISRKRAVIACQPCRAKKARCDNQRPTCSRCQAQESECVYEDATANVSFDRGTLAIINRLDYLIDLAESDQSSQSPLVEGLSTRSWQSTDKDVIDEAANHNIHNRQLEINARGATHVHPSAHLTASTSDSDTRLSFASCEDILKWPVFGEGQHLENIEALFTDPMLANDVTDNQSMTGGESQPLFVGTQNIVDCEPDLLENDITSLVEYFLVQVHTKNPILDPTSLRKMAANIVQFGLQWDGPTCLVLLTCALAVVSSPFARLSTVTGSEVSGGSLEDTSKYGLAESYYDAARKRIGLLGNGSLATECYFWLGVYKMYSLRPFQASISFNRACVTFQISTRRTFKSDEASLVDAHACRQYWSCLKSEHEISVELQVPSSGLTAQNYTQSFPSSPENNDDDCSSMVASPTLMCYTSPAPFMERLPQIEASWYYYLADIAARRILQRVMDTFYTETVSSQLGNIPKMFKAAEELSRQIEQWYQNLPAPVKFDYDTPAECELAYHLQARAYELQERTYRPFLFHLLNHNLDVATKDRFKRLAHQHSAVCTKLIRHWDIRHRHHGTWLMVRQSFNAALLLVAAQRSGRSGLTHEQYEEAVDLSMSTIRYWEAEAADLKASRVILESVVSQT